MPLEDSIDWRIDMRKAIGPAFADQNITREAARVSIEAGLALLGRALRPLEDYVPNARLDGVFARVVALSKAEVLDVEGSMDRLSTHGFDEWKSAVEQLGIAKGFLARCLIGVRFVSDEGDVDADDMAIGSDEQNQVIELIDRAGLSIALFGVARDFQRLSPLQRRGFGSLHPSTSQATSAASARPPDAQR